MKRKVVSLVCSAMLLGVASYAHAGAYGESEEIEERPAAAPAPRRPAQRVQRREEVSNYARSGPYLQLGGVYGFENFDSQVFIAPAPGSIPGDWKSSWGYSIRGGYRLLPMFAIEAQWEHFLHFNYERSKLGELSNGRDIESYILSANAKFYPLPGMFQPYLLAGLGWQNAQMERGDFHDFDEDALALRFGVGADIYFTEMIGLAAEAGYILPVTGNLADDDIDIIPVSLSIFFRFM